MPNYSKDIYWDATPLVAGQDYVVKEEGGDDWLPFPDLPSLQKIRHTWMVVRNERPKNPSFHGAPMPKRKLGNEERNALITMTYFHPFTLHKDEADEHVPHVQHLRGSKMTWEEALKDWFANKVLCSESQRFIQNFFNVAQMRPEYIGEEGKHDEDVFSDEELDKPEMNIDNLLRTQIGHCKENAEGFVADTAEPEGKQNATDGMTRGSAIWKKKEESNSEHGTIEARTHSKLLTNDDMEITQWKKDVVLSQKQEFATTIAREPELGKVMTQKDSSETDLRAWFSGLRAEAENTKVQCNVKQKEVIGKVMERIINSKEVHRIKDVGKVSLCCGCCTEDQVQAKVMSSDYSKKNYLRNIWDGAMVWISK